MSSPRQNLQHPLINNKNDFYTAKAMHTITTILQQQRHISQPFSAQTPIDRCVLFGLFSPAMCIPFLPNVSCFVPYVASASSASSPLQLQSPSCSQVEDQQRRLYINGQYPNWREVPVSSLKKSRIRRRLTRGHCRYICNEQATV